jgi:mono/diheme cytochrome c family protein
VYAISSLMTLVIINGILAFMLSPGQAWLGVAMTGREADLFWPAYFNPTFWPNLLLRTLVCVSLAGVWALVTCSRLDGEKQPQLKAELVRWSTKWLMPSFLLLPLAVGWYLWSIPEAQRQLLTLGVPTVGMGVFTQVTRTATVILMSSATILLVVYFFAWRTPTAFKFSHALAVVFLALVATASGEYTRELLRKPFVIGQYMYSNGVRVKLVDKYNADGYLTHSLWTRKGDNVDPNLAMGEAMFRGQCASCHTRDAYRAMKKLLAGRDREGIENVLKILHSQNDPKAESPYRRFMPPLVGKPEEIRALGDYLATLSVKPSAPASTNSPAKTVASQVP